MLTKLYRLTAVMLSLAFVSACEPDPATTRSNVFQEIGAPQSMTLLSKKFLNEVPYLVNFAFDEYYLDETAIDILNQQIAWIKAHPTAWVSVYGHTDLMGTNEYNIELGLNRAKTVAAYLIAHGIPQYRVEIIETLGEEIPLIDLVKPELINRRVATFVHGVIPHEPRARTVTPDPSGNPNPNPPDCTDDEECSPPPCQGEGCTPPPCQGEGCTPPPCTGETCTPPPPPCTGELCLPPPPPPCEGELCTQSPET